MAIKVVDNKGKAKSKDYDFVSEIKKSDVNESLVSQYVYVYLSNQRKADAKSKDRSEVRGGGKKPWRQKGTGRARVGSNRSPIWRGGGVTFGPTGEQNYKKDFNKKAKTKVFAHVLNQKYNK